MTTAVLQTLAQILTERLLNTALEGAVLAVLIGVLLRFVGRQNSGTRFAVWFSTLLTIVALPFLSGSAFGAAHSLTLPRGLRGGITLSSAWAFYLFAAWACVSGLLLLRLGVGLWRVRTLHRNTASVDLAELNPEIAGLLRDFGSRRRVQLCVSPEVAVPTAIGFFQPAVVFPAWLLPQLSPEEVKVILLHELAHLRRWDDWTNLAQKMAKAVFFFHPAVWWIENRLTLEREMACDDLVLAETASPRAYASSLISFAEKLQNARALAMAQALVSRMCHMSLRVKQILDAKRPVRTVLWKPVLGMSAGVLVVMVAAAPYAPRLVAVRTQPNRDQTLQLRPTRQPLDAMNRAVAGLGAQRSSPMLQARAIPAVFNPRAAVAPLRLETTSPRKRADMSPKTARPAIPVQETVVILQTTQFDASGHGVWTLCVWRVGGRNSADRKLEQQLERQLESAIVLSL